MTEQPRPGWVRGSEVPSAEALNELSRLSKENAELRQQLTQFGQERDVTQVIDSLSRRSISDTFSDKVPFNTTLLSFFEAIGRELAIQLTTWEIASKFALKLTGTESKNIDPLTVQEWLKDLALFDLVATRREEDNVGRTGVHYTDRWWLTDFGKKTFARIGNPEQDNNVSDS